MALDIDKLDEEEYSLLVHETIEFHTRRRMKTNATGREYLAKLGGKRALVEKNLKRGIINTRGFRDETAVVSTFMDKIRSGAIKTPTNFTMTSTAAFKKMLDLPLRYWKLQDYLEASRLGLLSTDFFFRPRDYASHPDNM